MKTKLKVMISIIIALCIIAISNTVQANYQSNNGTKKTEQATTWVTGVRRMEAVNNVMGLTETINANGTFSGESNNIDVHMMKGTEFGTMAILSASKEYGKQGSGTDRYVKNGTGTALKTTTGNISGIYFDNNNIGREWMAAGNADFLLGVASRYRNNYNNSTTSVIAGDAMNIGNWHSKNSSSRTSSVAAGYYRFINVNDTTSSIFTYSNAGYTSAVATRAAIVNGKGF